MNELHLFAGAGGGILGGMLLGHTPVCAVEIEPYPRSVLLQRQRDGILPRFPIWDDVTTFDGKPWRGIADVVCGGFPCQDISSAGKGAGLSGERSGLWSEMRRIIGEVEPRFVFVENSPMLTLRGLGIVLGELAEMGYDAAWGVLGAGDAGAPHQRDRIWILAHSNMQRMEITREYQAVALTSGFGANHGTGGGNNGGRITATAENGDMGNAMQRGRASEGIQPARGLSRQGAEALASTSARAIDEPMRGWWKTEPAVGRVVDGLADGMDRIAALGNGQVPSVAALAWRILSSHIPDVVEMGNAADQGAAVKPQSTNEGESA